MRIFVIESNTSLTLGSTIYMSRRSSRRKTSNTLGLSGTQMTLLKAIIPLVLAGAAWLTGQTPWPSPIHAKSTSGSSQTGQAPVAKSGETYTAKVIKVADGDTLTVQDKDGRKHKIRMHGIDAPETKQAHGVASADWMSARVLGTDVTIEVNDTDRYQREVAKVWGTPSDCQQPSCAYTLDINLEAIKAGQVWWYKDYAKTQAPQDRALYEQAETEARQARIGLWQGPRPTPPWEWRAEQRKMQSN